MEIRKARLEELDILMALYDQGRRYMREHGNMNQWINGYPKEEMVRADIASGCSYVAVENGVIEAVFYYIHGEDPDSTYAGINGAWLNNEPYGVIHRIASSGRIRRMVDKCSDWALEICPNLRMDTHADNAPMQEALLRGGFTKCGIVVIDDGSERVAFHKVRTVE